MCEFAWSSVSRPAKIFSRSARGTPDDRFHPTVKPVELMEWILLQFPEAQLVLDPFLGSGTTAVAAKMLGRKYIGIELSEKYCEIARQRVAGAPMPLFTTTGLAG